jgi:hypothetical protein
MNISSRSWLVLPLLALAACGGSREAPKGPPPEYETTPVMPWNANQSAEAPGTEGADDRVNTEARPACKVDLVHVSDAGTVCPDASLENAH